MLPGAPSNVTIQVQQVTYINAVVLPGAAAVVSSYLSSILHQKLKLNIYQRETSRKQGWVVASVPML
jgi:hypothetical protein